ncbi:MAG: chorismate mutase [Corynebacterium casei]|uniref:chorismate mutase n=1 Tax=Corynebacterium casei TaxID=160386 RepID=UPI003F937894
MDTSSESGLPEANNNSGQDELAADISAGNNADIRMPSGTDDPLSDAEIQKYREEINKMDRIILDAVKRRTKVSQAVGKTRMGSGGTRLVHTREISILNQFRDELGEEGPAIASALLRMGRGKLG